MCLVPGTLYIYANLGSRKEENVKVQEETKGRRFHCINGKAAARNVVRGHWQAGIWVQCAWAVWTATTIKRSQHFCIWILWRNWVSRELKRLTREGGKINTVDRGPGGHLLYPPRSERLHLAIGNNLTLETMCLKEQVLCDWVLCPSWYFSVGGRGALCAVSIENDKLYRRFINCVPR